MIIRANIVDILHRQVYGACLTIEGERIVHIQTTGRKENGYILPPFIDAHIHLESALVTPAAFADAAVMHGTLGACADPHEMANVAGMDGLHLMADYCSGLPFHFRLGIPPCVPATSVEDSPHAISPEQVGELLADNRFHFLAEVMDVDAVLRGDDTLMAKIHLAQYAGRPIDGHAPLLSGEALARYVGAGISTDHESEGLDEAREKVRLGMKVLIREGSDAQNFEALHPLIDECPDSLMFCTDDLRPDDLLRRGHIDALVQRAIDYGHDLFDVLRIASLNPARHYGIPIGMLQTGDYADFIATDSLTQIAITDAVFRGRHIYEDGLPPTGIFSHAGPYALHKELLPGLQLKRIRPDIFALPVPEGARLRVMTSAHGTLLTGEEFHAPTLREGCAVADAERDLAKLVVINRYDPKQRPAVAFLRGTHLRAGAIAQSISHDNHHIIACGVSDEAIAEAVNAIIRDGGGISVAFAPGETRTLQLPIGGLISHKGIRYVTEELDAIGRHLTDLRAPGAEAFPPLSFLSLIVIPHLKLSHKGLYRSASAEFVPPYVTA